MAARPSPFSLRVYTTRTLSYASHCSEACRRGATLPGGVVDGRFHVATVGKDMAGLHLGDINLTLASSLLWGVQSRPAMSGLLGGAPGSVQPAEVRQYGDP